MVFVQCPNCDGIFPSTMPVCPGCGYCPLCGQRRVTRQQLADASFCSSCQAPICACCGRCQVCGQRRFADLAPCPTCGFPTNPNSVATFEQTHGVKPPAQARKGLFGCLAALLLAVGTSLLFLIAVQVAGF